MFEQLESARVGTRVPLDELLAALRFDAEGLLPAIAQQHDSGAVLMLAYMNADAIRETLATGRVCYFSRSRRTLWRKGESSGQIQRLVELRVDCDGDTLLLQVDQTGPACHTGRHNCFYTRAQGSEAEVFLPVDIDPATLYGPKT